MPSDQTSDQPSDDRGRESSCGTSHEQVDAFVDGALTGTERQAVADHIATCASCEAHARELRRLRRQVASIGREPAPKALALRIRADLADASHTSPTPVHQPALRPQTIAATPWLSSIQPRRVAAMLAACLVSAALAWTAATWSAAGGRLEQDILSAHMRSLLQDSPIQVASSDSHTVKPWFAGRVDVSPDVKDLTADGFPLIGGRLDFVGGRRVGAVVYRRRQHVVNIFARPAVAQETSAPRAAVLNGYNLLSWSRNGIAYHAISDLNANELRMLQALL